MNETQRRASVSSPGNHPVRCLIVIYLRFGAWPPWSSSLVHSTAVSPPFSLSLSLFKWVRKLNTKPNFTFNVIEQTQALFKIAVNLNSFWEHIGTVEAAQLCVCVCVCVWSLHLIHKVTQDLFVGGEMPRQVNLVTAVSSSNGSYKRSKVWGQLEKRKNIFWMSQKTLNTS